MFGRCSGLAWPTSPYALVFVTLLLVTPGVPAQSSETAPTTPVQQVETAVPELQTDGGLPIHGQMNVAQLNNTILAAAVLILLLLTVIGAVYYRRQISARLADQQKQLASSLEESLRQRTAELENQMAERLQAEESTRVLETRLAEDDKMRALGQLTGGIAHDYNNLLTVIQSSTELIRHKLEDRDGCEEYLLSIQRAIDTCREINRGLLSYARQQPLTPVVVELRSLFLESHMMFQQTLGPQMRLVVNVPEQLYVMVDAAQLLTALINLLTNARDASFGTGVIVLYALADEDEPGLIRISVKDEGAGMTQEQLSKAHEPFYSTKDSPIASGLGLSMVYGFAYQSGGSLEMDSAPGAGTTVTIILPASKETQQSVPKGASVVPIPSHLRALVVDDHVDVANMVSRMLDSFGIANQIAHDGDSGLALWHETHPDILVTDVQMPGDLNGVQLAEIIKRERPDTNVLLISGFADVPDIDFPLLPKPFTMTDLRSQLVELLAKQGKPHIEH